MGSSSNRSLPSQSQVENQHNLNNNNNINSETVGKPSFTQNIPNNINVDMAPPPIKQNLSNNHPLDELLNENNNSSKISNNNNNSKIIDKPNKLPQNRPQNQPQPQSQNPNSINNYQQIQMQNGVASPYIQPVGIAVGVPNYPYPGYYYPPGQPIYPYPYYGPQPQTNSVLVLPPGYKPDYSAGYCPWGNLADDLNNLI